MTLYDNHQVEVAKVKVQSDLRSQAGAQAASLTQRCPSPGTRSPRADSICDHMSVVAAPWLGPGVPYSLQTLCTEAHPQTTVLFMWSQHLAELPRLNLAVLLPRPPEELGMQTTTSRPAWEVSLQIPQQSADRGRG